MVNIQKAQKAKEFDGKKKTKEKQTITRLMQATSSGKGHTCTEPPSLSAVVTSCDTRLPTDGAGVS